MSRPWQFEDQRPSSPFDRPPQNAQQGPPPSFKTNVNRNKTKRWVEAKSYAYDGDDWGGYDPYDEYGSYNEEQPPPMPPQHQLPQRQNSFDDDDESRNFSAGPQQAPYSEEFAPPQAPFAGSARSSQDGRPEPGHDIRRDFSQPAHVPPPLQMRASPAPAMPHANRESQGSASFPPRKSSLGQGETPHSPDMGNAELPPHTTPQKAQANPAASAASPNTAKALPFIRPADIYRRMAEEQEKERRSMDSARPSMDSLQRPAPGLASPAKPVQERTSMESSRRPSLGSVPESQETSAPAQTSLEPLPERKSEYGFSGFNVANPALAAALGAGVAPVEQALPVQHTENHAGHDVSEVVQTAAPADAQEETREVGHPTLSIPDKHASLPHVDRVASGFGVDFWGAAQLPQQLEAEERARNAANSAQDQAPNVQAASEATGTEPALQHQPSMGFTSVVHQAFDRQDDSSVPPTPITRDNSQSQSASDSSTGISPIMSRVPSAATAEAKARAAEARDATVPMIAEESSQPSSPSSRPMSDATLPGQIRGRPSPSHSRNTSGEVPATFQPGYRRSLGTPSPSNSPARSPEPVEADKRLSTPMIAEMTSDEQLPEPPSVPDPEPQPYVQYDVSAAETAEANKPADYSRRESDLALTASSSPDKESAAAAAASVDARHHFLRSHSPALPSSPTFKAFPRSPGPGPRSPGPMPLSGRESPGPGRVRELAGKYNEFEALSRQDSSNSLKSKSSMSSWGRSDDNKSLTRTGTMDSQAAESSTREPGIDLPDYDNGSGELLAPRPEPSRDPSFRPRLPGEWVSFVEAPGGATEESMQGLAPDPPDTIASEQRESSEHETPTKKAQDEEVDLTPTTAKRQLSQKAPSNDEQTTAFATVKSAGEALGAALMAHMGTTHQTKDFATAKEETPSTEEPAPRRSTGDVFLRPYAVERTASSVASSVPPTPPPKDTPRGPEVERGSDYFPRPTIMTQDSDMLSDQTVGDSPSDMESDRLRREIMRELTPERHMQAVEEQKERDQAALDAPTNMMQTQFDELHLREPAEEEKIDDSFETHESDLLHPAASTFPPPQQKQVSQPPVAPVQQSAPTHAPALASSLGPASSSRPGLLDTRFSWETSNTSGGLFQAPSEEQKPYERPTSGILHVMNTEGTEMPEETSVTEREPAGTPASEVNRQLAPEMATDRTGAGVSPLASPDLREEKLRQLHDGSIPPSPMNPTEPPTLATDFQHFSSSTPPHQTSPSTNAAPSSPTSASRIPPFREILALRAAPDRINTYNSTREQFATMNTGLGNWISATLDRHPEHSHLAEEDHLKLSATGAGSMRHKHAPSLHLFSAKFKSSDNTPTLNTGTGVGGDGSGDGGEDRPQRQASVGSPGGRVDMEKMQAKGKDLLHSAGVLGGKATVGAKGLFAKGRRKLRETSGSGEKVPPTPTTPTPTTVFTTTTTTASPSTTTFITTPSNLPLPPPDRTASTSPAPSTRSLGTVHTNSDAPPPIPAHFLKAGAAVDRSDTPSPAPTARTNGTNKTSTSLSLGTARSEAVDKAGMQLSGGIGGEDVNGRREKEREREKEKEGRVSRAGNRLSQTFSRLRARSRSRTRSRPQSLVLEANKAREGEAGRGERRKNRPSSLVLDRETEERWRRGEGEKRKRKSMPLPLPLGEVGAGMGMGRREVWDEPDGFGARVGSPGGGAGEREGMGMGNAVGDVRSPTPSRLGLLPSPGLPTPGVEREAFPRDEKPLPDIPRSGEPGADASTEGSAMTGDAGPGVEDDSWTRSVVPAAEADDDDELYAVTPTASRHPIRDLGESQGKELSTASSASAYDPLQVRGETLVERSDTQRSSNYSQSSVRSSGTATPAPETMAQMFPPPGMTVLGRVASGERSGVGEQSTPEWGCEAEMNGLGADADASEAPGAAELGKEQSRSASPDSWEKVDRTASMSQTAGSELARGENLGVGVGVRPPSRRSSVSSMEQEQPEHTGSPRTPPANAPLAHLNMLERQVSPLAGPGPGPEDRASLPSQQRFLHDIGAVGEVRRTEDDVSPPQGHMQMQVPSGEQRRAEDDGYDPYRAASPEQSRVRATVAPVAPIATETSPLGMLTETLEMPQRVVEDGDDERGGAAEYGYSGNDERGDAAEYAYSGNERPGHVRQRSRREQDTLYLSHSPSDEIEEPRPATAAEAERQDQDRALDYEQPRPHNATAAEAERPHRAFSYENPHLHPDPPSDLPAPPIQTYSPHDSSPQAFTAPIFDPRQQTTEYQLPGVGPPDIAEATTAQGSFHSLPSTAVADRINPRANAINAPRTFSYDKIPQAPGAKSTDPETQAKRRSGIFRAFSSNDASKDARPYGGAGTAPGRPDPSRPYENAPTPPRGTDGAFIAARAAGTNANANNSGGTLKKPQRSSTTATPPPPAAEKKKRFSSIRNSLFGRSNTAATAPKERERGQKQANKLSKAPPPALVSSLQQQRGSRQGNENSSYTQRPRGINGNVASYSAYEAARRYQYATASAQKKPGLREPTLPNVSTTRRMNEAPIPPGGWYAPAGALAGPEQPRGYTAEEGYYGVQSGASVPQYRAQPQMQMQAQGQAQAQYPGQGQGQNQGYGQDQEQWQDQSHQILPQHQQQHRRLHSEGFRPSGPAAPRFANVPEAFQPTQASYRASTGVMGRERLGGFERTVPPQGAQMGREGEIPGEGWDAREGRRTSFEQQWDGRRGSGDRVRQASDGSGSGVSAMSPGGASAYQDAGRKGSSPISPVGRNAAGQWGNNAQREQRERMGSIGQAMEGQGQQGYYDGSEGLSYSQSHGQGQGQAQGQRYQHEQSYPQQSQPGPPQHPAASAAAAAAAYATPPMDSTPFTSPAPPRQVHQTAEHAYATPPSSPPHHAYPGQPSPYQPHPPKPQSRSQAPQAPERYYARPSPSSRQPSPHRAAQGQGQGQGQGQAQPQVQKYRQPSPYRADRGPYGGAPRGMSRDFYGRGGWRGSDGGGGYTGRGREQIVGGRGGAGAPMEGRGGGQMGGRSMERGMGMGMGMERHGSDEMEMRGASYPGMEWRPEGLGRE